MKLIIWNFRHIKFRGPFCCILLNYWCHYDCGKKFQPLRDKCATYKQYQGLIIWFIWFYQRLQLFISKLSFHFSKTLGDFLMPLECNLYNKIEYSTFEKCLLTYCVNAFCLPLIKPLMICAYHITVLTLMEILIISIIVYCITSWFSFFIRTQ